MIGIGLLEAENVTLYLKRNKNRISCLMMEKMIKKVLMGIL